MNMINNINGSFKDSWHTVALNAVPTEPWRNGGGTTQALLAWPNLDDWQIRCSVACVASAGPFSSFNGVKRWFSVLSGAGVILTIDGQMHMQTIRSSPLQFDGAAQTSCQLIDGETHDFNLMLRGRTGSMRLIQRVHKHTSSIGEWLGIYSHTEDTVITAEKHSINIPAKHIAWTYCTASSDITTTSYNALWMQSI